MRDVDAQNVWGSSRVTATRSEIEAPEGVPRRKSRWKADVQGIFILAVMNGALIGALVFVVFVRIG